MSSESPMPEAELAKLREALACIAVGVVVASILYGITVLQAYIYYKESVKEPLAVKFLVALVCFFDTAATVFITVGSWIFFVEDFGNQTDMPVVKDPPSEALVTGANVFIALITQLFFAYSLWIFSKKNGVLTSIAVVLALGSFGPGIWIASRFLQANSLFDIQTTKARIVCGLWNGLGATCDVFIALVLSYYFHKSRSMSNSSSDSMDERLMQYMIECCGITALCQMCILVTFTALPGRVVFFPFLLVVGKFYSNTLLGSLNVRQNVMNLKAINSRRQDLGPDALATLGQLCNISINPHSGHPTDAGNQTMSEVCIGSPSTGSEASDPWRKALVGDSDRRETGTCGFSDIKEIV